MTQRGGERSAPDHGAPGLQAAGVGEVAEQLYRLLLRTPHATLADLAVAASRGAPATRRALGELESAGLVSRRGRPTRFVAAAPDVAIEALIMRRHRELERCRVAAAGLLAEYRETARGPVDLVEIVEGRDEGEVRYLQLLGTARDEVLMFDKPPYITAGDNPTEDEVLARGVTWRTLYASEGFELPDRLDLVRGWQAAGEQARVSATVPLKLVIVDRRIALLPLVADDPAAARHSAVLVHPSSLLTTLVMLFDMLWNRAVPLGTASADADTDGDAHDDFDRAVLQLLVAGVKDQAIARQLGVSLRTVRRRLANLMAESGVASRFQLGVLAARRDWV